MSISADFAYGSSGAPVLNRFGAVVGMATVTSNIDYPAEEPSADESAGDNGKRPQKPLRKAAGKGVFMTVAKSTQKCADQPSGVEAEPSLVQMVVKMAVPGRTIQEFCTAGASSEPAKAK